MRKFLNQFISVRGALLFYDYSAKRWITKKDSQ